MKNEFRITQKDIEGILNHPLSATIAAKIESADLRYEPISNEERDLYILDLVNVLLSNEVAAAGESRLPAWEAGWGANLQALKEGKKVENLIPGYHGKHKLLHWKQEMIRPLSHDFDYQIFTILVDWLIETYLNQTDAIFEFGCGPAYHLLRARKYNPKALLVGLDWATASQQIIKEITEAGIESNICGYHFNFFEPDFNIPMPGNSGIMTVAALEQVGDRFEPFLQFLLAKKPVVCIHIEPIDELMDPNHLIDRLSVLYCRKRNYLKGFLPRLQQLEAEGKIKIHLQQRSYTGSYFIEGHSIVIWSPL